MEGQRTHEVRRLVGESIVGAMALFVGLAVVALIVLGWLFLTIAIFW